MSACRIPASPVVSVRGLTAHIKTVLVERLRHEAHCVSKFTALSFSKRERVDPGSLALRGE
jgi:hypothetical protein